MTTTTQRRRRALRAIAPVAGLLAAGLLVWQGSYAAFSATTDSKANAWTAGSVVLKNDAATGTYSVNAPATFSIPNMRQGDTGVKCVVVESSGTLASSVKFYAAAVSSNALAGQLNLKVELDNSGAKAGCTGFAGTQIFNNTLTNLSANSYATGLGTWTPTGVGTQYATYRFTWTLSATAPSTVMGQTANADFVWEGQST